MNILDITKIMELIPHRYPFLLVDKILQYESEKFIHGLKNVTFNEHFFTGHFPKYPIFPGVLIIEAMAQVSAILAAKSVDDNIIKAKENDYNGKKDTILMNIDQAKFRRPVFPGDSMFLFSEVKQKRGSVWSFSTYAKVEDKIVAESQLMAKMLIS